MTYFALSRSGCSSLRSRAIASVMGTFSLMVMGC